MIIGETLSGKTSAYKALIATLNDLADSGIEEETKVDYQIINPKALTIAKMYGKIDTVSNEWSDGVLASVFRKYTNSVDGHRKWIIFDGPVDAIWVENLNTVLDDNKKANN